MHGDTSAAYMGGMEGGDTFQAWPPFYRWVYDPIWRGAADDKRLPKHCRKQIGRIHDRLERLIAHADQPRLLHWDIWNTNVLVNRNGDGKWHVKGLLDPNAKYGHAEAEIAYHDLVHTVTPP